MNWKKLITVSVLSIVLISIIGCKTTKPEAVRYWHGAQGDVEAWEKAKVIMENYDWEVREDLR